MPGARVRAALLINWESKTLCGFAAFQGPFYIRGRWIHSTMTCRKHTSAGWRN